MSHSLPRFLLAGFVFTLAVAATAPVDAHPHLRSGDQQPSSLSTRLKTPAPWQYQRDKADSLGEPSRIVEAVFGPALPAKPLAASWQAEASDGR
ncbi:hypothetical protein D3879_04585 [Pseudomonas cavernicola]|uniref:Uncharacterized protein n=1 Tax=Pseudomonas cavernicola TaxID=2320866 RepID=A0A418XJD0_9PSED|nr:hypothetical protein [Pseudomonas cavernicola]RJG12570.1 hypothetical protein D3879_04585 [Pseudomonas cavernicola]